MKFKELLTIITEEEKMVLKIRGGKNHSFKCTTPKDFSDSLQDFGNGLITIIADVVDKVLYVVNRSSFHINLAKEWNLPKESTNRYLHLVGNFSDKGFTIDKLQMSQLSKKILKDLDSKNWIKKYINV